MTRGVLPGLSAWSIAPVERLSGKCRRRGAGPGSGRAFRIASESAFHITGASPSLVGAVDVGGTRGVL